MERASAVTVQNPALAAGGGRRAGGRRVGAGVLPNEPFAAGVPGVVHGAGHAVLKNGFDRLAELPEWYTWLVFTVCTAAVGIRGGKQFFGGKK